MNAERWRRIEEIYYAALERAASERRSFLESACGDDATLRADVERLIAAQDRAGDFLIAPAWEVAASALVAATTKEDSTMSLVGRHIATYEILAPLGVGGMGEVYRARDTKLNREVAMKVLPEVFALDPDRLARFRREAHVLASLNHPNIAAIHGFEETADVKALVLELVEGPTLADRIARGRMPLDEALPVARQIAEALEAAHERGVVHRDLKPANIKVRADGTVKVLDFGLAKVLEPGSIGADPSQSPTAHNPAATQPGLIIGTAAYMAPEQARGRPADKRADIWAFGCVLYEMLSGVRAFSGQDVSETLAAVIRGEPNWHALTDETPAPVRRLLRRCLAKDPKGRLSDASMARLEIDETLSGSQPEIPVALTTARRRERFAWASALTLVTVIAIGTMIWALRPAPPAGEVRVEINTPPTVDPLSLAISPDGQKIVFVATSEGRSKLLLRSLDSDTAAPLVGTDGAMAPFWSPDSQSVAFFASADGTLKRTDIDGRSLQVLAKTPGIGGTWNRDGTILFTAFSGIMRVSDRGGEPAPVTQGLLHLFPQFLPDGRHFLFHVPVPAPAGVYVGQLDGSGTQRIIDADAAAVYASGHLLFVRQGTLLAQAFDPVRLVLSGTPFRVAQEVAWVAGLGVAVSASSTGTLIYRSRAGGPLFSMSQLMWFDRSGKELGNVGSLERRTGNPSLSSDGRHVALTRGDPPDIWLLTLDRAAGKRFTTNNAVNLDPIWSPDGRQVVWSSNAKGAWDLYQKPSDGEGNGQVLYATPQGQVGSFAADWSQDGRYLLYGTGADPKTRFDIWALPLEGDQKPFAVVQSSADDLHGQFSPDGKWIAYQSNETGRFEIYLQPFGERGGGQPVSTTGGAHVRWRPDGRELFYIAPDGRLMAVPIELAPDGKTARMGAPNPLFATRLGGVMIQVEIRQQYVVSPDGKRFLMNTNLEDETAAPITVVFNWKPRP